MLELKDMRLEGRTVSLCYNVKHNVGSLRTTLEQTLELKVDTQTGKVGGELHLTELECDSIEAAREKMAFWCERMAAALRGAERKDGELPLYGHGTFKLEEQPLWLQEAYAQLVARQLAAHTDEDRERISQWLQGHPMTLVRGLLDSAEAEVHRAQEAQDNGPDC